MQITEKRLRQIIRETLLEEQYRIDETYNLDLEQLKQAARAALISVGIATSPALVNSMATSISDSLNTVSNQEYKDAHSRSIENESGFDQLLGRYGKAINKFVTQHPTLHNSAKARKNSAIAAAEEALVDAGMPKHEIDKKFKDYYNKASMYSY